MAFKSSVSTTIITPQEKKQRRLIVILLVLLVGIAVVLYFGFFYSSGSSEEISSGGWGIFPISPDKVAGVSPITRVIEDVSFDVSFLKRTTLQGLKDYGGQALEVGRKGRANPFIPY